MMKNQLNNRIALADLVLSQKSLKKELVKATFQKNGKLASDIYKHMNKNSYLINLLQSDYNKCKPKHRPLKVIDKRINKVSSILEKIQEAIKKHEDLPHSNITLLEDAYDRSLYYDSILTKLKEERSNTVFLMNRKKV